MTPRLALLFLRSRSTGPALVELAAVAGLGALVFVWAYDRSTAAFLTATVPLAPAVVLGAATHSPVGEAERTASRSLPALRLGHLVVLLAGAVLALVTIGGAGRDDEAIPILLRNGAGFAGLALLGARLVGAGLSWALPLIALLTLSAGWLVGRTDDLRPWAFQDVAAGHASAATLVALLAGLALVTAFGARPTIGEASD